jgi:hypothetical protein
MDNLSAEFPATLEIEYPNRELNRLTTFFRLLTIIPIGVVLALVTRGGESGHSRNYAVGPGGIVFLATVLMLLFRQKYPRWWFDWNLALTKFATRVLAYLALLRDEYPSTDGEQAVHVMIPFPNASLDLNRWLPLVKWLLAIPHYVVLMALGSVAMCCVIVAWFAILFSGRYPRSLFHFVVGCSVGGYVLRRMRFCSRPIAIRRSACVQRPSQIRPRRPTWTPSRTWRWRAPGCRRPSPRSARTRHFTIG